jgi:hypothetical protein
MQAWLELDGIEVGQAGDLTAMLNRSVRNFRARPEQNVSLRTGRAAMQTRADE